MTIISVGMRFSWWVVVFTVALAAPAIGAAETATVNWAEQIAKAKAAYRPLAETDLAARRGELAAAISRLDARLQQDGENGARWRRYLKLQQLQDELKQPKPSATVLGQAYQRLTSGYDGLWLVCFADVRHSLLRYLQTSGSLAGTDFKQSYEQALDQLGRQLADYSARPDAELAWQIALTLRLLQDLGQAPELIEVARGQFHRPNLRIAVSRRMIARNVEGEVVDDVMPVHDCILKSTVIGRGVTNGRKLLTLIADDNRAVIETVFQGTTHSKTTAYQGPVAVFSDGVTQLSAGKRIYLSESGVDAAPAEARAQTSTTFTGMCAPRLLERIAWKKAYKQKGAAEYVAARLAEQKLKRRVESEGAEAIAKLQDGFEGRFRRPLHDYGMMPELLKFSSNPEAMRITALMADRYQLAAAADPPAPAEGDLVVQIHESLVNNVGHLLLSGMTMREESLRSWATERMKLKLDPPPADSEPVAVAFPATMAPVAVEFDRDEIAIIIRGERIYKNDELISRKLKSVDIKARYQIRRDGGTPRLVRQGDVQVLPTGYKPGEGKPLSAEVVLVRNALKAHLERAFRAERALDIDLESEGRAAGRLNAVDARSADGWLIVSWRLAASEPSATVASAAD